MGKMWKHLTGSLGFVMVFGFLWVWFFFLNLHKHIASTNTGQLFIARQD